MDREDLAWWLNAGPQMRRIIFKNLQKQGLTKPNTKHGMFDLEDIITGMNMSSNEQKTQRQNENSPINREADLLNGIFDLMNGPLGGNGSGYKYNKQGERIPIGENVTDRVSVNMPRKQQSRISHEYINPILPRPVTLSAGNILGHLPIGQQRQVDPNMAGNKEPGMNHYAGVFDMLTPEQLKDLTDRGTAAHRRYDYGMESDKNGRMSSYISRDNNEELAKNRRQERLALNEANQEVDFKNFESRLNAEMDRRLGLPMIDEVMHSISPDTNDRVKELRRQRNKSSVQNDVLVNQQENNRLAAQTAQMRSRVNQPATQQHWDPLTKRWVDSGTHPNWSPSGLTDANPLWHDTARQFSHDFTNPNQWQFFANNATRQPNYDDHGRRFNVMNEPNWATRPWNPREQRLGMRDDVVEPRRLLNKNSTGLTTAPQFTRKFTEPPMQPRDPVTGKFIKRTIGTGIAYGLGEGIRQRLEKK